MKCTTDCFMCCKVNARTLPWSLRIPRSETGRISKPNLENIKQPNLGHNFTFYFKSIRLPFLSTWNRLCTSGQLKIAPKRAQKPLLPVRDNDRPFNNWPIVLLAPPNGIIDQSDDDDAKEYNRGPVHADSRDGNYRWKERKHHGDGKV